jgi:hypothetical protein
VKALSNLLSGIVGERSQGPLAAQQAEYDTNRAGTVGAINEGFGGSRGIVSTRMDGSAPAYSANPSASPMQQREAYKRNFTEQNSPATLQTQRINDEQFRQGRQLNANNRTIAAQMAPSMMEAETRKEYNDALLSGKIDATGFKGMNRYGPQFTPAPQINPNQINNNMQKEFGYLQSGGNTDPFATFGQPNSPTIASDNAIRTAITNSGMQPRSQQILMDVLSDPEARGLSFDELRQTYEDFDELGQDAPKVQQFLLQLRGK